MDYNDEYIPHPRFIFDEDKKPRRKHERLQMGSSNGGIIFDVTTKGILVNGYYAGLRENVRYTCMREPVEITWENLEKMRKSVTKRKKKKEKKKPRIEQEVDGEYLKTLPVVHLNGVPYYIDSKRKERRPVSNPHVVNSF